MNGWREQLEALRAVPAFTQLELDEMDKDYRAEKRSEGDDEVRESRRHAEESLCYEHE